MADNTALVPYAAPPVPALVDSTGRPLRTAATILTTEIAAPTVAGLRNIISSHPAQGLDPTRLTQILRSAEQGNATAYLELAEEMEEKYPHYQSVLGTRKRAVSQLPVTVNAASEDTDDEADAQFLREWLDRLTLQAELFDMMDGLGKGFAVTEIIWSTGPDAWLPAKLKWRFPQFFEYDRVTGEQLLLRGGVDGTSGLPQPLPPYKFIVHEPKAKSGLPIRGGLARTVAWYYLFVNFTIKDWMTFLEVYGLPLRVGKYQNGTSEEDIRKLAQAVAQIGSDAGCVIPQSMMIDFVTSNGGTANPEMFEKLCKYADDQVSKAVLGQTSSADAKSGGLGSGQANLHSDVRDDIRDADAAQLSATLTEQLAVPIIQFNRGIRKAYPTIIVGKPDEVDVEAAIKSMQAGVAMNVPIGISYFRKATGIPEPKAGEELLSAPAPAQAPQEAPGAPGGPGVPKNGPAGLLAPSYGRKPGNRSEVAAGFLIGGNKFVSSDEIAAFYNPHQPRVPRGTARGGEWSHGHGGLAPAAPIAAGKLTKSESAAVASYSLMDYKTINEQARGEAHYGDATTKKIEAMDHAVGKGRLAEPATLYRGVSGPGVKALQAAGLSEGSIIRDPGFLSTSRSRDIVDHNFSEARGSITIAISAKKGAKALDAAPHSNLSFEQEVIFPRHARMRVTRWDKRTRTLHVEHLDD